MRKNTYFTITNRHSRQKLSTITTKEPLIIIAAGLSSCAGNMVLRAADGAAYYYGQVSFFSPDGKLPYGNTDSAVKREVMDGGERIVETVTQPGPGHAMSPREFVTELKRRKKTLVYDVSDAGGTFTGSGVYPSRVGFPAPNPPAL